MSKRLLLDTNILLDVAMEERPEHAYALMLMEEFAYGDAQGYIASLSIKDVYYVLSKYASERPAREYVLALMELLEVVRVDSVICKTAASSDEPDLEDGIVRACAESLPVDYIISRDASAFERSTIKRYTPQEYLRSFCELEDVEVTA